VTLELRMLDFLHFKDVGGFRVLQVLSDLVFVVELEGLEFSLELLLHLVRERREVLIIEYRGCVELDDNALNRGRDTSDSIVRSSILGVIPTMMGTGAVT
jgi:hypothetical protein